MLTLKYDPDQGIAEQDGMCEELVGMFAEATHDIERCYSTENVFVAVRCAIAEGRLNYAAVQFKYGDQVFQANRFGVITCWPEGFCDQSIRYVERILKAAYGRKQSEKKGA